MPNLASAKKALRQSVKRGQRNQIIRDEIASMRRRFRKLLEAGKMDEAKTMIPLFDKKLDKSLTKKVFKKNKVARIKSRIAKKLATASK